MMTMANHSQNFADYTTTTKPLNKTDNQHIQITNGSHEKQALTSPVGLLASRVELVNLSDVTLEQVSNQTIIDHRHGRRRNLLALAEIRCRDEKTAAGVITNLGWNGMFVMTEATLPVNSCVDVRLVLPDVEPVISFPGLVVHNNPNGFGMIFRVLDDEAQNQVHEWMC